MGGGMGKKKAWEQGRQGREQNFFPGPFFTRRGERGFFFRGSGEEGGAKGPTRGCPFFSRSDYPLCYIFYTFFTLYGLLFLCFSIFVCCCLFFNFCVCDFIFLSGVRVLLRDAPM